MDGRDCNRLWRWDDEEREPGHADSIDRDIAAARRRLLIAKGQLSLF